MKSPQQIFIIHGGNTFSNYSKYLNSLRNSKVLLDYILAKPDWKINLQKELGNNFLVFLPQFPNKQNAKYREWKIQFNKYLKLLNNNFILIGHSLGASFIVKFLSENKINKKIKKTILLGTPYDSLDMGEERLNTFLRKKDLNQLLKQAGELYFYHSKDDFAVPFSHLKKYKISIPEAKYRVFNNLNHFIVNSIPQLLKDINS